MPAAIRAVVEIARIGAEPKRFGNIAVPLIGAVAGDIHPAVLLRFLCREGRKVSGYGIVRAAALPHKVQRYRRDLERCAALLNQHLIIFRDIQRAFELCL